MMSLDLTSSNACPEWEDLKAWVDEELEPSRRASLEAHVAACASCREEARLMRQIGTTLRQLEDAAEPSPELRARILARVEQPSRPSWWTLPGNPFIMLRWVTVATAVLVVGVVGRNAVVTETTTHRASETGSAPPAAQSAPVSPRVSDTLTRKGLETAGTAPAAPAAEATSSAAQPVAPPAENAMRDRSPGGPGDPANSVAGGAPAPTVQLASPTAATSLPAPEWSTAERERRATARTEAYSGTQPRRVSAADINAYTRGKAIEEVRRKVVRRAELTVRTRSPLESVQKEIQVRLRKDDGYVESSNLTVPAGTERTVRMTLRVPVEKLDDYLTWLAGLGEVQAKNVRGEDVTGTWVDQRAEVREMRKEEERLLDTYNSHRSRERREEARRLLLTLRPRIAVAEERFALTGKLAALSTLTLTLIEPEQVRVQGSLWQDLERTTRAAVASFMLALRIPAAILIWLVVFSPLWVPCLLLFRWAGRKAREWNFR